MLHTKRAFRGLSGTYNVANERSTPRNIECLVEFPDNTQHVFTVEKGSKGQTLLELVFAHLNIIQDEFFSLRIPQKQVAMTSNNNNSNTNNATTHQHQQSSSGSSNSNNCSLLNASSSPLNDNQDLKHAIQNDNNSSLQHSPIISSNQLSRSKSDQPQQQQKQNDKSKSNEQPILSKAALITPAPATTTTHTYMNDNLSTETFLNEHHNSNGPTSDTVDSLNTCWLDPNKGIVKQYKNGPPYKLVFCVRFYVSEVSKLTDPATKHLLYLQLKNDISQNRLPVNINSATILSSLILQIEQGDFNENLLRQSYLSKFNLIPDQSKETEKKIVELHRQLSNMTSAEAKNRFLEHATKKLDCYGVEFYDAKDINKILIRLGVSSSGIVVFKHNKKISDFPWGKIIKIMFKRKIFSIQLHTDDDGSDDLLEYNLLTNFACKSFWQECVAQHSFFRLQQPKNNPKKFFSFLNFGSKFQYNGKTEYQTIGETCKRSLSHFSRSPSKRYARRAIPVGWTSWNSNEDSSKHSADMTDNSFSDKNSTNQIVNSDHHNNGNIFESQEKKNQAYKSLLFIDEYGNQKEVVASTSATQNGCANSDNEDRDEDRSRRKKLARSESTRLSNKLKSALFPRRFRSKSGNQFSRLSESLFDKFLFGRGKTQLTQKQKYENVIESMACSDDEHSQGFFVKTIKLSPGKNGKYGFKIRGKTSQNQSNLGIKLIIIHDITPDSPAATSFPRLHEGDQIVSVNGQAVDSLIDSDIETLIKQIQQQSPPDLLLKVHSRVIDESVNESNQDGAAMISTYQNEIIDLPSSISKIRIGLATRDLVSDFDQLARRKEDESLEESKQAENIDKNRYRDILPYDSTRVTLLDSMTGDYINASYVDMRVPSGQTNRYIATQGPLPTTCDDFWQMVWEQNCSLIIMVTPLIEAGRTKCHKYWPDEKEHCRHGQIVVRNVKEKARAATIERTLQLGHIQSDEKRISTQIQYCAWPDHEVPEDCSDFLKLVNRVRKHRTGHQNEPIIVHCSAGIGRTGVLILMETAICIMESGEPVFPLKILEDMRKQRAMLIQTNSQFQFVADAICQVYDQKLFKNKRVSKN